MSTYLNIAHIRVSIALILVFRALGGGGGLGGIFGTPDTVFRTRRGIERTLFRLTIALATLFILMSIFSVRLV